MSNMLRTPFAAIFRTEVLLNSKRVVPYALAALFAGNAVLWWGWGAAVHYGWATNGDFFILRNFGGFSFLTLPLFDALVMGDPVIRDFRLGVAPLIFSKPVRPAAYLLGKFCGNFFVLVCCQSVFALTLILLQGFRPAGMVVQPPRVAPFVKHFLVLLVVSHLLLAAIYFTVGALTRNAKLVYGLAVCFYPLYFSLQLMAKGLPPRWRIVLDPLLVNWVGLTARQRGAVWTNAAAINQLTYSYDAEVLANRALVLLLAVLCLTILCLHFRHTERGITAGRNQPATLGLSTVTATIHWGETLPAVGHEVVAAERVVLPVVNTAGPSVRANLEKLRAALNIELRLLRAERSLIVLLPLAVFFSTLELAFYQTAPAPTYTAAYAGGTAQALLLFLFGFTVFYTGEAMHRDRELRVEPLVWSAPAPDYVLLLSKFLAAVLLDLCLLAVVATVAVALQLYHGHRPVELAGYLLVYAVVLLPSVIFIAAASVLLNVLLRDKYLAYAASIATGGGLFYLYSQGYNHWLYNPVLYRLWTYTDLTGGRQALIFAHRIYWLAAACACLSLAHILYPRKTTQGWVFSVRGGAAHSLPLLIASAAVALGAGLMIVFLAR